MTDNTNIIDEFLKSFQVSERIEGILRRERRCAAEQNLHCKIMNFLLNDLQFNSVEDKNQMIIAIFSTDPPFQHLDVIYDSLQNNTIHIVCSEYFNIIKRGKIPCQPILLSLLEFREMVCANNLPYLIRNISGNFYKASDIRLSKLLSTRNFSIDQLNTMYSYGFLRNIDITCCYDPKISSYKMRYILEGMYHMIYIEFFHRVDEDSIKIEYNKLIQEKINKYGIVDYHGSAKEELKKSQLLSYANSIGINAFNFSTKYYNSDHLFLAIDLLKQGYEEAIVRKYVNPYKSTTYLVNRIKDQFRMHNTLTVSSR